MTKIKIVDFFGKKTSHLVGFCKKIGIIWVFGQKMAKMKFWGFLLFQLAAYLNFVCLQLLNALIPKNQVGLI